MNTKTFSLGPLVFVFLGSYTWSQAAPVGCFTLWLANARNLVHAAEEQRTMLANYCCSIALTSAL